mmetsp:Transcript_25145/g.61815  ORF Transcript_25145/g.61815 Transcript_25145/m.61815 type:complete len:205 (+) Transcript_25145:1169-1783(+)
MLSVLEVCPKTTNLQGKNLTHKPQRSAASGLSSQNSLQSGHLPVFDALVALRRGQAIVDGVTLDLPALVPQVRLVRLPRAEAHEVGERAAHHVEVGVELPDEALRDGHGHDRHGNVAPEPHLVLLHELHHAPHHLPHVDRRAVGRVQTRLTYVSLHERVHIAAEPFHIELVVRAVAEENELLHHAVRVPRAHGLQEVPEGLCDV